MPSPFPGMDPYLEGSLWSSVHAALITQIAVQLSPRLRPRYIALLQKRFVTDMYDPEEELGIEVAREGAVTYPDVAIATKEAGVTKASSLTLEAPLRMQTVMPESVPTHTVEIRDVQKRKLVTAIEVLSPVNKRGEGRREYLERRQRYLTSPTHLVEIDLLRSGHRVPMTEALPRAAYFAFVSRAGRRPTTEVWPIALDSKLPSIPVPLLPGDEDLELNLQDALATIYGQLNLDLGVDYSKAPEVPLDAGEQEWARGCIARWESSSEH
jgi:uncharacterized protein DUF4058